MIISLEQIRQILFSLNLKGKTLHIATIKDLISSNYSFSQADLLAYGKKLTYKTWEHQVQEAMFHLKRKGIVKHDSIHYTYTF